MAEKNLSRKFLLKNRFFIHSKNLMLSKSELINKSNYVKKKSPDVLHEIREVEKKDFLIEENRIFQPINLLK